VLVVLRTDMAPDSEGVSGSKVTLPLYSLRARHRPDDKLAGPLESADTVVMPATALTPPTRGPPPRWRC